MKDEKQLINLSTVDFQKHPGELGCFLNYQSYQIFGTNEKQKRTFKIKTGISPEQAIEKAASAGLNPPFEAVPIEYEAPTEKQLNYLNNLGVFIPDGITKADASCMISRATEDFDSLRAPSSELTELALNLKIEFSAFIGDVGLLRSIVYQSSDRDRAALYAYGVHQSMRGASFGNMLNDSELSRFYDFADFVISDPALLKSLENREPEDYRKPHRGTAIYKAAEKYFNS